MVAIKFGKVNEFLFTEFVNMWPLVFLIFVKKNSSVNYWQLAKYKHLPMFRAIHCKCATDSGVARIILLPRQGTCVSKQALTVKLWACAKRGHYQLILRVVLLCYACNGRGAI